MKTPEQIADEVITNTKSMISGWANGTYTPSEDQYRGMMIAAIKTDRAQRVEIVPVTTHDSRCTLGREHDGPCNVSEWRG